MTMPTPRTPRHDAIDFQDPRRELWLEAAAALWDNARAQTKAQLTHTSAMVAQRLGGTIVVTLPSTVTGRAGTDVSFLSEGFAITGAMVR